MLYTLGTCHWCEKTKEPTDDLGIRYGNKHVDQLHGEETEKTIQEPEACNPRYTFQTLVTDNEKHIIGYRENEIKQAPLPEL
jgi:glutaredoxin-like protein NrdH